MFKKKLPTIANVWKGVNSWCPRLVGLLAGGVGGVCKGPRWGRRYTCRVNSVKTSGTPG